MLNYLVHPTGKTFTTNFTLEVITKKTTVLSTALNEGCFSTIGPSQHYSSRSASTKKSFYFKIQTFSECISNDNRSRRLCSDGITTLK